MIRQLLTALAFLFCVLGAQANDLVTDRAWVEDPSGQMTLAQVEQAPQTPLKTRFFSQGYSQSYFWLRLHLLTRLTVELGGPRGKLTRGLSAV